jgi:hypothetical protein
LGSRSGSANTADDRNSGTERLQIERGDIDSVRQLRIGRIQNLEAAIAKKTVECIAADAAAKTLAHRKPANPAPITNTSTPSPAIGSLPSSPPRPLEIGPIIGAKTDEVQSGWLESREKGETVVDSPDDKRADG